MSERKVLQKYYPPDFDPSRITRTRGPKPPGPKVQTVRLMAPFSMKCTACGEFIYKGRKFNARKETTDDKYYSIAIYRFYIRCTRCSGEITFKTDPKNMDYECEKGARRNFEPWRTQGGAAKEESEEERLVRLEEEEAERGVMAGLEGKVEDARREMRIADALDEIRTRNARNERVGKGGMEGVGEEDEKMEGERERLEREDEELARRAFMRQGGDIELAADGEDDGVGGEDAVEATKVEMGPPPPTFKRAVKRKKDFSAALGIKRKPALV